MNEYLRNAIQEAFGELSNLNDLARLYFDIRMETEKQLEYMSIVIAKDMRDNGVLDNWMV